MCVNVLNALKDRTSPSPRRAWIEINVYENVVKMRTSPSPRRAWIEIPMPDIKQQSYKVALPTEGVD